MNKVEIKQKKAADSDEVQNTFAFVTISIDDGTLRNCLQEFKSQQFRGRYLQVTVARENFLEKLKREREEAEQHKQTTKQSTKIETNTTSVALPCISTGKSDESESESDDSSSEDECEPVAKQNGSKKCMSSSESSSSSDSEPDNNEENLVLKKKSKIFVENGKVIHIAVFLLLIKILW